MTHYSLKDIRFAYIQKKNWEKQFPLNYLFVRPVSFYITYFTLKVTQDPGKIAIFGFFLGALGCFLLALSSIYSIWPGFLLIFLFSLFDAVDGNVARTTNNVTLFGKFLDGFLGDLIYRSYPFFLGIGLCFSPQPLPDFLIAHLTDQHAVAIPLFLGSVALISGLWASCFERTFHAYHLQKEGCQPISQADLKKPVTKSTRSGRWYYMLFLNIDSLNNQLLLLLLFCEINQMIWFLFLLACFFVTKAIYFFLFYYDKAAKTL